MCPQNPTIAVSSVFSPDILVDARKCPAELCLNVFPVGDKTHILCSYLSSHEPKIQKIISHLSSADKYFLRYEISKLVLSKCDNFVLSPKVLGTFSTKQVEKIKDFILKSKLTPELDMDDPSLYLFYD